MTRRRCLPIPRSGRHTLANEPADPGFIARLATDTHRWTRLLRTARNISALIAAAVLAVLLGIFYLKAQEPDIHRQHEVLRHFWELKEIDARWDLEVLRARSDLASPPAAINRSTTLSHTLKDLAATARSLGSPALDSGLPNLNKVFSEKAGLMAEFRKASATARQALQKVMDADNEIAGLIRGAWRDYPQRERLVAVENVFLQLLSSVQKYYFSPTDAQRQHLEAVAADLRDAATALPKALYEGISRIDVNVRQLLTAKVIEQELFNRLSFLATGPRVNSLASAFSLELGADFAGRERYRAYLIACAGALLILAAYLGLRLFRRYRLLTEENFALQARNAEPGKRLAEGTQEAPHLP